MEKKLLQISSDFADQKVYVNLVRELSRIDYKQIVYVPVRWQSKIDGNRDDSIKDVSYYYSYILKRTILFKLRYYRKINLILADLESKIEIREIGLVHAHFLFSDGGVAYRLKKKYNIPYVVSVRATDVHYFFPLMIHLRKFGNKILQEAERVVFINHSYKNILRKKYLLNHQQNQTDKFVIIPNAIDNKWFQHPSEPRIIKEKIGLLYVGRVIKRKKLDVVINALKKLNKVSTNTYHLEVVGAGPYLEAIKKISDHNTTFHGAVTDFELLKEIYRRNHIFVMPSVKETFGLVYVEALSQGLPIVYCKNEGVDGFFDQFPVGSAVAPNSTESVVEAIKYIEGGYESLSLNAIRASKTFNWHETTQRFDQIYQEAIFSSEG